jgi:ribosome biogenesis GTPase A
VAPQKEIKPRTFQLNDQQTIFLGGVARFDYVKGPRSGVVAYFDNNLNLHRTKLENADAFYEKHMGGLLTPPTADDKDDFPELERHEFHIDQKSDLVIEGLGWVTVPAGTTVAGWAPVGVSVLVRKAMI